MQLKELLEVIFDELSEAQKRELMCNDYNLKVFAQQGIRAKIVDQHGGEDEGSDFYAVYSFTKDAEECFVKFFGWYASHYGVEYQGFKFVNAQEKTIIVYE